MLFRSPTGFNGTSASDLRPAFTPSVTTGFGGKEAPVQPPHPEI